MNTKMNIILINIIMDPDSDDFKCERNLILVAKTFDDDQNALNSM